MQYVWTLCTVGGIPIRLHLSVGVLVAYLLWQTQSLGMGLFISIVLFISILLHELAHSAVAILFGGWVHDITLQVLGGCATLSRMPQRAFHELLMAAAGPMCSLSLAAAAWMLARFFSATYWNPITETTWKQPNDFFLLIAWINLGLGAFNLIPAFPMDGGRILRALVQTCGATKVRATEVAVVTGQIIAGLWVLLWILGIMNIVIACPFPNAPEPVHYTWSLFFGRSSWLILPIAYMVWTVGRRELTIVRLGAWR